MLNKKKERSAPEINAASMADIAFMLLIFFLVTTTINPEKGITTMLPPWSEEDVDPAKIKERNRAQININPFGQVQFRGELVEKSQIKELVKDFVTNPSGDENKAINPTKAVVSLKNDRGTKYEDYLQVYDALMTAYEEMRNEYSQANYSKDYADLDENIQKEIRNDIIPRIISEAEPTAFGDE